MPLAIRARPPASGFVPSPSSARPIPSIARPWGIRLIALTIGIWLASLGLGFHTGLVLLTLMGFAAAVAGLGKPALGVLGIAMLCTLDAVSRIYLLTGGLLRWNTFNYWLVVVMLLHLGWLVRLRDPQIRLLQAFLALLTVELVFSADLIGGAQHVLNLVTVFGLLIYFARASSDREVWYWSAMLSGVVSGLGSMVFYLQQESLPEINPNAWAFFPLTSLFAASVYFASPVRRRRARVLVILAIVNAGWVFLSGSRGSLLICVVCLLFILVRLRSAKGVALTLAAATLLALIVAIRFGEQGSRAADRLTNLFDSERTITNKTSGRWDLAVGGWHMFLDEPFGVGTGGFAPAWATLHNQQGISAFQGESMQAHSAWVKILAENGVPGIILFTAFVLSFAVMGWRRGNTGLFLSGLLVTFVLSVAFLADEFQGKGLWFLAGGILLFRVRAPGLTVRVRGPHWAGSLRGAPATTRR